MADDIDDVSVINGKTEREYDPSWELFLELVSACQDGCGEVSSGKGSVRLFNPKTSKPVPFAWRNGEAKLRTYVALCKKCAAPMKEQAASQIQWVKPLAKGEEPREWLMSVLAHAKSQFNKAVGTKQDMRQLGDWYETRLAQILAGVK